MDENKNGTVSAEEYCEYYGNFVRMNDAQMRINSLDRNLDGELSLDEFEAKNHHNLNWIEQDEEYFVEADADGDGKLSITEAIPLCTEDYSGNQVSGQVSWEQASVFDQDGDGKLSRAEVLDCQEIYY